MVMKTIFAIVIYLMTVLSDIFGITMDHGKNSPGIGNSVLDSINAREKK